MSLGQCGLGKLWLMERLLVFEWLEKAIQVGLLLELAIAGHLR